MRGRGRVHTVNAGLEFTNEGLKSHTHNMHTFLSSYQIHIDLVPSMQAQHTFLGPGTARFILLPPLSFVFFKTHIKLQLRGSLTQSATDTHRGSGWNRSQNPHSFRWFWQRKVYILSCAANADWKVFTFMGNSGLQSAFRLLCGEWAVTSAVRRNSGELYIARPRGQQGHEKNTG